MEEVRGSSNQSLLMILNSKLEHLKQLNNMNNILQAQLTDIKSIIRNSSDITDLEDQVDAIKSNLDTIITQASSAQTSRDTLLTDNDTIISSLSTINDTIPEEMYITEVTDSSAGADHYITPNKSIKVYQIFFNLTGSTGHHIFLVNSGVTVASGGHICQCAATQYPGFSVYAAYSGMALIAFPVGLNSGDYLHLDSDISRTMANIVVVYSTHGAEAEFTVSTSI